MKKLFFLLVFLVSFFSFKLINLSSQNLVSAENNTVQCEDNPNKVLICHQTSSETHTYEEICLAKDAVLPGPGGGADVSKHGNHEGDIIPPFDDYSGKNWLDEATWRNDCVVPDQIVPVENLKLTSMCWINETTHKFRVRNTNLSSIDYDWMLYGVTGWNSGNIATVGDSYFNITGVYGEANTTKIRWLNELGAWKETTKAVNQSYCSPTGTPVTETPPACPTSYSCDACLVYPYPDNDCYSSMYDYCVETYNCRWVGSNDVLRETTISNLDFLPNGQWVCDCLTEPTPTDEPSRGGNGDPGAPVCNDTVPPTPSLISAVKLDFDTVKLTWNKVSPANDYAILYGQKSGDYPYAVFSTGNIDNFDINGVTNGCFVIKAVNGCMPGGLSSEVCTGATGGQVLGASTLGSTGGFAYDLNTAGFALGFILAGFGIRKASSKKVQ